MIRYVAGFLFWRGEVLLLQKQKPEHMKGRWNGIGGKIEDRESPLAAMIREFEEETGLSVTNWKHFATLQGEGFEVVFFASTQLSGPRPRSLDPEIEKTQWFEVDDVRLLYTMNNLNWLIQMAWSDAANNYPYLIREKAG